MAYQVIKIRPNIWLFNKEEKIIARVPTIANWNKKTTDNDLYFGILGKEIDIEKQISEIVGINVNGFNNQEIEMTFNQGKKTVLPRIGKNNHHIELHIRDDTGETGIKNIYYEYMKNNNVNEKEMSEYAIFLDFKKKEIFLKKVAVSNKEYTFNSDEIKQYVKLDKSLEEIKKDEYYSKLKTKIEKNAYINVEIKQRNPEIQRKFREDLLKEFKGKCAICSINVEDLLIASHTIDYASCDSNKDRINMNNGLLLCKNHDGLFDKGYISFDDEGKIILPKKGKIKEKIYHDLNLNKDLRIETNYMNEERKEYLSKHREKNNKKLEII